MNKFLPAACLSLASLISILASCNGAGNASETSSVDTVQLKGEILIPYEKIGNPFNILTAKDKIYLINNTDTILEQFDSSGNFERRFLTKGQGVNEVSRMNVYYYNEPHNGLMLSYEGTSVFLVPFDEETTRVERVFMYDNEREHKNTPENFTMGFDKWLMNDGSIITTTMNPEKYFAVVNSDGDFVKYAVDYIPKSDFGEGLPSYLIFNFTHPYGATSPDGKHAAWRMGAADMRVFASLDGDSVKFVTDYVAAPNGINVVSTDNKVSSFEYSDDRRYYTYGTLALSNKHVYETRADMLAIDFDKFLNDGAEGICDPHSTINVYDYDGNLVKVLQLDCMPGDIAVTADDSMLYCLNEYGDDVKHVKSYRLK